jgi:hypothetical protein
MGFLLLTLPTILCWDCASTAVNDLFFLEEQPMLSTNSQFSRVMP